MKRTEPPTCNWELPDVQMPPDDGTFPVLTAEQWVFWFRTLPTYTQIEAAKSILELQSKVNPISIADMQFTLERAELSQAELKLRIVEIQNALRSILDDTKGMKPQKKRAAMLAERIIAIGAAIKGMRL